MIALFFIRFNLNVYIFNWRFRLFKFVILILIVRLFLFLLTFRLVIYFIKWIRIEFLIHVWVLRIHWFFFYFLTLLRTLFRNIIINFRIEIFISVWLLRIIWFFHYFLIEYNFNIIWYLMKWIIYIILWLNVDRYNIINWTLLIFITNDLTILWKVFPHITFISYFLWITICHRYMWLNLIKCHFLRRLICVNIIFLFLWLRICIPCYI